MKNNDLEIFITGDFCPVGRNEKVLEDNNFSALFGGLEKQIQSADLSITNLEAPVTNSNCPIKKTGPNLKTNKNALAALNYAGFDLVTLANNHIMDYGAKGLASTLDACSVAAINTVGAGKNLNEAKRPYMVKLKNKKIAILNFAENEFCTTTGDHFGANPLNLVQNYYSILEARNNNDLVIVISHGGREHCNLPTPSQKDRFRFFVNCGADAVIGHHTHCVGGYEMYNNKPIFYSLGNFIFDYKKQYRAGPWTIGIAVKLLIKENNIEFEVLPFHQGRKREARLELLKDDEKVAYMQYLYKLNEVIKNDQVYLSKWNEYIETQKDEYKSNLVYQNRYLRYIMKRGWLPKIYLHSKSHIRLLSNMFRCESHREIMIDVLKESIQD